MEPLKNPQWEAFARAVAAGESISSAYEKAGFRKHSANAQRLAKREIIKSRIECLRAQHGVVVREAIQRTGITVEETLAELGRIGFSDIRGLFTEGGGLKHPSAWPDDLARAVASIEVVTKVLPTAKGEDPEVEYVHKVRLWPKTTALDAIAKHLQMYVERKEVEIGVNAQLAQLLDKVVNAQAALPIGAQRSSPNLRVVNE